MPRPKGELDRLDGFRDRVTALVRKRLGDGIAKDTYSDEQKALHATLDFLLGALHSLQRAHALNFQDRTTPPACESLLAIAADIPDETRLPEEWRAGYYFNSALLRMAACFHRSLKIRHHLIFAEKVSIQQLEPKADKPNTKWVDLWSIHQEVNDLKHAAAGHWVGRDVSYSQALTAMDALLKVLEVWDENHS